MCSDGLWNYASEPEALARELGVHDDSTVLEAARGLCAFALASGGRDNVTVMVARLGGRDGDGVPI